MPEFKADIALGTKVLIDNDKSLVGTVTAVSFRMTNYVTYEVSYINNGQLYSPFVESWRVTRAPYER